MRYKFYAKLLRKGLSLSHDSTWQNSTLEGICFTFRLVRPENASIQGGFHGEI